MTSEASGPTNTFDELGRVWRIITPTVNVMIFRRDEHTAPLENGLPLVAPLSGIPTKG